MLTNTIRISSFLRNPRLLKEKLQSFNFGFASMIIRVGLAAFLILGIGNVTATAQNVEVSGTVTDADDGSSLPGVNIILKGTSTGTSTNTEGNFSLRVPSLQDTLMVSFVGYITQTIPINGRNQIDIALQSDVQQLEDVVVVGYGTQEKEQITGSVTSVKEEDFVQGNVSSATELVQGKVPGLTISSAGGGDPNSNPTLRLRGISSFGANQEPLIVVDGVIGANLDNIDPNDIASMDVLRDASASAIYGTRGSAGVIVVTTKSGGVNTGTGEVFSITYNGTSSLEMIENKNEVLSADEYLNLSQQTGITAPDLRASTNWFDQITQEGFAQTHSLALSGNSENTSYRISGNFRDREGILKESGFQQINTRLNLTQTAIDQKLKFTFNIGVTSRQEQSGFAEAFRYAQIFNPTSPVRDANSVTTGGFFEQDLFDYFNPASIINTAERENEEQYFTGSIRAEYEFEDLLPGLLASAFYSVENTETSFRQFFAKTNKLGGGATSVDFGPGSATRNTFEGREELFEVTLNYQTDVENLGIEALAGYSYNEFVNEGTNTGGGDFVSDAVGFSNLSFAQDFTQGDATVESFDNNNKLIGAFGRINLNYDDTYRLNASIRREGSTRFGVNNKWGNFWAAGAGLEVTNLVNIDFLDRLKLRGSIGKTGQDAPESGLSKQRFAPSGNFFVNGAFIQSFSPVSNPNPDLKWEEKTEWNVGIDFELLDSRLAGSVEYYEQDVDDLLFQVEVPQPPNLFPTTWDNVGTLESNGLETSLSYAVLQDGGLSWNTSATFTLFGETLLKDFVSGDVQLIANAGSPGLNSTPLIKVEEGEPIGQIFGPEFAEIGPNGEWLFFDQDGNMITADQVTLDDQQVLGNGLPDYQFGLSNNFNYKNWDLSFFIRGVFGHQLVNTFRLFYETPNQISSYNVLDSAFDVINLRESPQFSSFQVENGDFIKLQNASLGYTVPLGDFEYIKMLQLSLSVNNAFTITNYKGINPEPRYVDTQETGDPNDDNPLAPGIERRDNWFTSRIFSFGVKLEL